MKPKILIITLLLLCFVQLAQGSIPPNNPQADLVLSHGTPLESAWCATGDESHVNLANEGVTNNGAGCRSIKVARYFTTQLGRWSQPEPLLKGVPGKAFLVNPQKLNPYVYCGNNPLIYADPNGLWSIKVELSQNRDKTGSLIVLDRKGKEVGRYSALGRGSNSPENENNHKNRLKENGDTPTGKYAIVKKEDTKDWNQKSYGPNGALRLDPISGQALEAENNGRSGFLVHGGDLKKDGSLRPTNGCPRLSNEDIENMMETINTLESNDKEEKAETLEVVDIDDK